MITFLVLSLLVLLHELGHFVAARIFGVRVEEFGLGLPPKALLIGKRGDTEYTLNYLPLGGFVRLYGEQGELSALDEVNPFKKKRAFVHKPAWQRAIILLAGVVMNLLIGVLLFAVIYSVVGVPRQVGEQLVVSQVVEGSPAELADIRVGDVIVQVGDFRILDAEQFIKVVNANRGKAINLYVKKLEIDRTTSDSSRVVTVVPRENPPEGQGALGVGVADVPITEYDKKSWFVAPFFGAVEGVKESYLWSKEIAGGIFKLFGGLIQGQIPAGLSGPVGVVKAGNEAVSAGWIVYLRFIAVISINLGIFNLLPLPALDGGRLIFLVMEKFVARKKIAKIEAWVHGLGFILLISLLGLVTWSDLKGLW